MDAHHKAKGKADAGRDYPFSLEPLFRAAVFPQSTLDSFVRDYMPRGSRIAPRRRILHALKASILRVYHSITAYRESGNGSAARREARISFSLFLVTTPETDGPIQPADRTEGHPPCFVFGANDPSRAKSVGPQAFLREVASEYKSLGSSELEVRPLVLPIFFPH